MTLVDSRAGIVATAQAAVAEHGGHAPTDELTALIGIPLDDMLAPFVSPHRLVAAADRYRQLYPTLGVPHSSPLPGAEQSLQQVRALHGRVVVVSAKPESSVRMVLERAGLEPRRRRGRPVRRRQGHRAARPPRRGVRRRPPRRHGRRRGGRGPRRRACRPGRTTPRRCGRPGRTWCSTTSRTSRPGSTTHVLDRRLVDLEQRLAELESLVVAFSGGADSAFLLAAAVRALGPERVVAATAVSSSLASGELDDARAFAEGLGVRHLTPSTDEMAREGYRANAGDRCFFCKAELLDVLGPLAGRAGCGRASPPAPTPTTCSPASGPGIRAAAERGALTPLARQRFHQGAGACGLSAVGAADVGQARRGLPVEPHRLRRADHAVGGWRASTAPRRRVRAWFAGAGLPLRDLRVRDLGSDRARVEVDHDALTALDGRAERACGGGGGGRVRRDRDRPARIPLRVDERAAEPARALPLTGRADVHEVGPQDGTGWTQRLHWWRSRA